MKFLNNLEQYEIKRTALMIRENIYYRWEDK